MAILKARENSSDTFQPVATMGVGNASQSQRGLMTAQDKVKVDTVGDRPSGETDTLWDKVDTLENRDTYSTTEQVIGTWIDGKPLYRSIFDATLHNNDTWEHIDITTISNIGVIVDFYGIFVYSSQTYKIPYYESASFYSVGFIKPYANQLEIRTKGFNNNLLCKFFVVYTKTTD